MSLLDTTLGLFVPHECLGCGEEGSLLCERCSTVLPAPPRRCYFCLQAVENSGSCSRCSQTSQLDAVYVVTTYNDIAKDMIWRLKYDGAQAVAKEIAALMSAILPQDYPTIVPAPTASRRARQRGYDQAVLLARALSRHSGLPYHACLTRHGQSHQVGATREQRTTQLQAAFRVNQTPPSRVLLVDDVLTTGATLEAAAKVLRQAGAKQVSAVVFAQAV